jgi:transport and Golgi organization protein 2
MCTVSIIGLNDGFRLVCNRDEARNRPLARPPEVLRVDGAHAVMPTDPESGGTWVAGTTNRLAFAILNLNVAAGPRSHKGRSRGEIIPLLLACRTLEEASEKALELPVASYRPFRLVIAGPGVAIEVRQSPPMALQQALVSPLMFTSSGLGDRVVEAPRRELFERIMAGHGSLAERQDQFQRHRWRSRPHISVNMSRQGASTVSRTVLEVEGSRVLMEYTPAGQSKRTVTI